MSNVADWIETESERVERWRLTELIRADYPLRLAEKLASRFDIDLHEAVALVKQQGCEPRIAARILL